MKNQKDQLPTEAPNWVKQQLYYHPNYAKQIHIMWESWSIESLFTPLDDTSDAEGLNFCKALKILCVLHDN